MEMPLPNRTLNSTIFACERSTTQNSGFEPLKCVNHPTVDAIEECAGCRSPLCGICCNFTDEGAYCERCLANRASARKVEQESQRFSSTEDPEISYTDPESEESKRERSHRRDRITVWFVAVATAVICSVQMFRYSNPELAALSPIEQQQNEQLYSLAQCAVVYKQIGLMLNNGQEPPEGLVCSGQEAPHIITQQGDLVRFSHPDPGQYGYAEISVSNDNPEPILIALEDGDAA